MPTAFTINADHDYL